MITPAVLRREAEPVPRPVDGQQRAELGTGGSDTCSGVTQSTWQFSRAFDPFTGR